MASGVPVFGVEVLEVEVLEVEDDGKSPRKPRGLQPAERIGSASRLGNL